MEFGVVFGTSALLCAFASLALSYRTLQMASRSAPEQLVREVGQLRAEAAGVRGEVQEIQARLTSWRIEIENVLESVEGTLELVERKRRSTAASASKIDNGAGQVDQMDTYQLEQLARGKGLL